MSFPKEIKDLSRTYDNGEEREVAAFVRNTNPPEGDNRTWLFHSRGSVSEAHTALRWVRPGFSGGIGTFPRIDVKMILDQPAWGDRDYKRLMWDGPSMTVEEFHAWISSASTGSPEERVP